MLSVAPGAWVIVGACAAIVGMAFGALVNIAVFLVPLAADFGWPRGDLSLAYSIAAIGTGLGGILMGHFSDRMPVRRIALAGALVQGGSLLLLASVDSTLELYLYHAMLGFVGLGAVMAPLNNLASRWFARNPGLAIGIVSAGGALGQGLMPFLSRHLVLVQSWREAYMTMGILYLATLVPLALLLRDPPRAVTPGTSGTSAADSRYAMSSGGLLALLSVAVVFCCVCMATPIVHVATLGTDRGLYERDAAGLLMVMMIFGMAGRIVFGAVADRYGNLQAYFVAALGQTALAVWFPYVEGRAGLYVLSAVFGLFFSGAMTSLIACAREYSHPLRTGLSIGVVLFFAWLGMALGAWQGGVFYDLCGDYFQAFSNAALGGAVNLLVIVLLHVYTAPLRPGGWRATAGGH